MTSAPTHAQLLQNCKKAGPLRARGRARASSAPEAAALGRLIDALIVRMTAKGVDRGLIAAVLGLDRSVVACRLANVPPARRRAYESRSLAELANLPPGWTARGRHLPKHFFA